MSLNQQHKNPLQNDQFFIRVLAPQLETTDENLKHYYDFDANIKEFEKAFKNLNIAYQWQYVTLANFREVIDRIAEPVNGLSPVFLNLCDGDEVNGAPGISVIRYLEEKKLVYTGARENFYYLTTSKITMKEAFDRNNIPSAPWYAITRQDQNINDVFRITGSPIIVKPAISGGSMGLGIKNVVNNDPDLSALIRELYSGYHGWDFTFGGLVAEKFITGPEFTTFITGSFNRPDSLHVYQPVERVFNKRLPDHEKFLSFDRLWETYEDEKPCGNGVYEDFYNYFKPDPILIDKINRLTIDAYCAVEGTGYGRVDIRMDQETGDMYVLEVNAQCGLSEDENYTSIGAMVRLGDKSYSDMIAAVIEDALLTGSETKFSTGIKQA